jgi:hypothetical protein
MIFTSTLKDLLDNDSVEFTYSHSPGMRLADIQRQLKQMGERVSFQTTEPGLHLRLLADWNEVLVPNMPVEVISYKGKQQVHIDDQGIPSLEGYRFLNRGLDGDRTPAGFLWATKNCSIERSASSFEPTGMVITKIIYSVPK